MSKGASSLVSESLYFLNNLANFTNQGCLVGELLGMTLRSTTFHLISIQYNYSKVLSSTNLQIGNLFAIISMLQRLL